MIQEANQNVSPLPARATSAHLGGLAALVRPPAVYQVGKLAVVGAAVLWSFWPVLVAYAERWWRDPKYSHGYIVPLFALYLLWDRRQQKPAQSHSSRWGLGILLGGFGVHLLGTYLFFNWLNGLGILLALAGLVVYLGGWPLLRWTWPAIAFLGFMLPLPYRVEVGASLPLQRIATVSSTYVLQTLGFPALSRGNIIVVGKHEIGVLEACNGLSMLYTFCAVSAAVAVVVRRPLADRLVVLASAIPIAIVSNVARIVLFAVLYDTAGPVWADDFYHHRAGWIMMFLALGLLWLELKFLSRLLVARPETARGPVEMPALSAPPALAGRAGGKRPARALRR